MNRLRPNLARDSVGMGLVVSTLTKPATRPRNTRRLRYGGPRRVNKTRRNARTRPRANTHYSVQNSPNNGTIFSGNSPKTESIVRGDLSNNGDGRSFRPTSELLRRQLEQPPKPIVRAPTPVRTVSFNSKAYRERQRSRSGSGSGSGPHTPSRRESDTSELYSVVHSEYSGS